MASVKGHFKVFSNKDIITEAKHIKNKDPSSYNWTPEARKEILSEFNRRQAAGKISKTAGTKKKSNDPFGFGSIGIW